MKRNIEIWLKRLVITTIIITMSSLSAIAGLPPQPQHMAPHAVLQGPIYTYVGNEVILDGSESTGAGTLSYNFDYGPGGWHGWQSQSTATTTYNEVGAYTAQLMVRDFDGCTNTDTQPVFVNGASNIQGDAHVPLGIYHVNQWIDINVSIENMGGPDVYWSDVEVEILNFYLIPVTSIPGHFESALNPLGQFDIHYFEEIAFKTNKDGIYNVHMRWTLDGESWSSWTQLDSFIVWP